GRFADPLVNQQHQPVKDGQQNVLFGREIIGELATAHACLFLDLGQRQILEPLLGNDRHRGRDDLLAANTGNIDELTFHTRTTRFSRQYESYTSAASLDRVIYL